MSIGESLAQRAKEHAIWLGEAIFRALEYADDPVEVQVREFEGPDDQMPR
jgi:hypothetical protein